MRGITAEEREILEEAARPECTCGELGHQIRIITGREEGALHGLRKRGLVRFRRCTVNPGSTHADATSDGLLALRIDEAARRVVA